MSYFFCWLIWNDKNIFSFGYSQKVTGHVEFGDIEYLTPEEIGQELGGN